MGLSLFLFFISSIPSKLLPAESVSISSGSGFSEIAQNLYQRGIIRSPKAFLIYGVLSGSAHQLKPGGYFLNPASSTPSILRRLVKGPLIDKSVVIPEGATVKDIDTILASNGVIKRNGLDALTFSLLKPRYDFLRNVRNSEGFLFPDTYQFFVPSASFTAMSKLLNNFSNKAWPVLKACETSKCRGYSSYEVLTLASLLEKEAPDFEDRRLIAGVLYRRLKAGIGLHVDATIVYAKCAGAFLTCRDTNIYRGDTAYASPYNTYLHKGLPPGPISNPGLEAIKAAIDPIDSEYLYYLSDPKTKKTIFSKTLEDHNENRAKYLDRN